LKHRLGLVENFVPIKAKTAETAALFRGFLTMNEEKFSQE